MPIESNLVSLNGEKYQLVADNQTPRGKRQWERRKRQSQPSDPGVQKVASWRLNGPHGLSREDPAGGQLAVDYAENMDTLYESLLLPGPKRNPIDLLSVAHASSFVEVLVAGRTVVTFDTAASSNAVGTQPWSNPSNALVDSTTYASATGSSQFSEYLKLTAGAASRVPTGARDFGIEARIRRYAAEAGAAPFLYQATHGSQTLNTASASTSNTVTLGQIPTAGTLLVAVVRGGGTATVSMPTPSGWTQQAQLVSATETIIRVYTKVCGAGETAAQGPWVLTTNSGSAGADVTCIAGITAYGPVDTSNPIDAVGTVGSAVFVDDQTPLIAPSMTAGGTFKRLVGVFTLDLRDSTFATPASMSERFDQNKATLGLSDGSNANGTIMVSDQALTSAGITGTRSSIPDGGANSTSYAVLLTINGAPAVTDELVKLVVGGVVSGVDHASADQWPEAAAPQTYGAPTDQWGVTLTDTTINAAGLGIVLEADLAAGQARVEYADMPISYITPTILPVYAARVGAFPVGGAPVGGGTATSVPQTVTNIDEDRGALFFHGGAFSFQVNPSTMTAVAYHQWEASVRGAAMWRNKGYVGLGSLLPMQRRLTVSAENATYQDVTISTDPVYAGSIVVGPDRVWWVDPEDSDESNLRYSLDQLATRSNAFLVGDPGIPSTGLGTYGRSALAGSEIGAFGFTDLGLPVRVLESLRGQRSPFNGRWITTLWGWTYITTSIGLKATIPGQIENPAGPGADRRYEGPNGRVTAIWPYKDALFAAVLTPEGNCYVYRGEYDDGRYGGNTSGTGRPAWFPFAFIEDTQDQVIFSTGLRTNPTLLTGESANAAYYTLSAGDRDISDPLYRFHTGTGRWYGTTMMRSPNLHKNPRYFALLAEDVDADNTFQIKLSVDGRDYVAIGSAVDEDGHQFVYPAVAGVPLSTVSGHFFKPQVESDSDDDTSPPKLRGTLDMVYDERPDTIIEHAFIFELGRARGGENGAAIDFATLSALFEAHGQGASSPFAFELPSSSQTIYGLVVAVGSVTDLDGDGIQRCTVTVQEWPTDGAHEDDDE